jgi:hypothetical protein
MIKLLQGQSISAARVSLSCRWYWEGGMVVDHGALGDTQATSAFATVGVHCLMAKQSKVKASRRHAVPDQSGD